MRLEVLKQTDAPATWYADGLKFTCQQCGNCCTGGPGFVWISDEEVRRLAQHLGQSEKAVREQYCRRVTGRWSLKEHRNTRGEHDCIFLREQPNGGRRTCSVYAARPLQCRTWPFWSENLASQTVWNHSARRCAGMNQGKTWTAAQIEALRTANDWPDKAPGSGR
jgi:uncharacterized protein